MCTRVLWTDSGQGPIVGRSMDWAQEIDTALWVMPRGPERGGDAGDPNPMRWRARYGSVVATVWDEAVSDGLNERGLGAHILWLAESDFGARDPELPAVTVAAWAQYALDCFETVEAFVRSMRTHPFQVRAVREAHSGKSGTVHLAVEDASGDSALIEYLDGEPVVHHGPDTRVTTNSPPFDQQLAHLGEYEGLGGDRPLPGTAAPSDRFVRAAYYSQRLPKADSPERSYAELLSVMRNAAQPFGTGDPGHPEVSSTLWRTLADLGRGVYAFESSFRPDPVWVRLDALNLDRYQRLDPAGRGVRGDATERFEPGAEFVFPSFGG